MLCYFSDLFKICNRKHWNFIALFFLKFYIIWTSDGLVNRLLSIVVILEINMNVVWQVFCQPKALEQLISKAIHVENLLIFKVDN